MLGSNLLVTADRDRSKGCGNTRLRFVGHIDLLFVWIRVYAQLNLRIRVGVIMQ